MMAEETGEGKQTQLLRLVMRKAIEDVIDSIPFSEVIGKIPNMKKRKATGYSDAFKKSLGQSLENVVESLFEDEGLDQLLKMREELIDAQKGMEDTIAWRPSGSVVDDMRSFNMNVLTVKRSQATAMCEKAEREVEILFGQVQEARSKALNCQKQLAVAEDQIKDLVEFLNTQEEATLRIADSLTAI